jgi:hypothetical protein
MVLNWDAISAIGEIVGAIAVLATLLYLASQIRQNALSTQNATWRSVTEMLSRSDITEATDPVVSSFIRTAEDAPDSLGEEEWWKFSKLALARVGVLEYAFLSSQRGLLDTYYWVAMRPYLRSTLTKAGYQKFWSENKHQIFHPSFIAHVDALIGEVPAKETKDAQTRTHLTD